MKRRVFVKIGAGAAAVMVFFPRCLTTKRRSGSFSDAPANAGGAAAAAMATRISDELFTYVVPDRAFSFSKACAVHVLRGPKKTVLMDSGESAGLFRKSVLPRMQADGLKISGVEELWHTHGHPDHIGADALVQGLSGARICAHPAAIQVLRDIPKNSAKSMIDAAGEDCSLVMGLGAGSIGFVSKLMFRKQRISNAQPLTDGMILDIGFPVEVKFTPGHSPDHVAYYVPSKRILFTGDAFITGRAVWPVLNTPASDFSDLQSTLEWMSGKKPAIIACGHCGTVVGETRCGELVRQALGQLASFRSGAMNVLERGPASLDDFVHLYSFKHRKHRVFEARIAGWCLMKSLVRQGAVERCPEYKGKKLVGLKWRLR